ncbi:MAG TPA: ABC transporter [Porticoccaceae bacterium]|jgi:ABC-type uncharacterized transport system involved in gliding motility auxiliary subunit|nr:ABC transporter [Gammaproteobacteria bacterium]HIL60065.1 ABC transporter [Porticoccaceae bacterium]
MNIKSLSSSAGLIVIAVGLVFSVAIITMLPSLRIDLTEDNLYSLSEGTRSIVSNLGEPLELNFFYSESATEDIPQIRSYGTRVQELLREIVLASNGRLTLNIIDPEPFSVDEDLATQYGIQAVPVTQGGRQIYFGLVVSTGGSTNNPLRLSIAETLPLIRPDQEEFLEYEFMKMITKVANPDLQVIGLITELDIDGGFDPSVGQATPAWMIMDIIRQLYEVSRVDITGDSIDDNIDILMIVHPQGLSEQLRYAIDQHVLRGGKAIVFLDPNAETLVMRSPQGALIPAGMSSDLPDLLNAWGVQYDPSKVLADNELAMRVTMGASGRPVPHLGMIGVQRANMAESDIITNRLETVYLASSGAISQAAGASTRFEPLMQSSVDSMLMESALLENVMDPSILFDEFAATEESYVVAARISGMIESAFPDGRPAVVVDENPTDDAETGALETAEVIEEEAETPHIASSNAEVNLLVFADTDLLSDRMWVQVAQFLGQRIPQPFANNGDMVFNGLDNLSGGAELASIRSRGRYSRPFTRVVNLQRTADDRLRSEEAELLDSLAETEASLAELNQAEDGQPIGQISPEIQAEVDRFNAELLDTRRRLREVQYQLTEDIERLGSNLKAINTALIPVLLTLLLLLMGYLRGQRRKTV